MVSTVVSTRVHTPVVGSRYASFSPAGRIPAAARAAGSYMKVITQFTPARGTLGSTFVTRPKASLVPDGRLAKLAGPIGTLVGLIVVGWEISLIRLFILILSPHRVFRVIGVAEEIIAGSISGEGLSVVTIDAGMVMTITWVVCTRLPLVPIILNIHLPEGTFASAANVTVPLPIPVAADGVIEGSGVLTVGTDVAPEKAGFTARVTWLAKLLSDVMFTVVPAVEPAFTIITAGAAPIEKSGVAAGGTTLIAALCCRCIAPD